MEVQITPERLFINNTELKDYILTFEVYDNEYTPESYPFLFIIKTHQSYLFDKILIKIQPKKEEKNYIYTLLFFKDLLPNIKLELNLVNNSIQDEYGSYKELETNTTNTLSLKCLCKSSEFESATYTNKNDFINMILKLCFKPNAGKKINEIFAKALDFLNFSTFSEMNFLKGFYKMLQLNKMEEEDISEQTLKKFFNFMIEKKLTVDNKMDLKEDLSNIVSKEELKSDSGYKYFEKSFYEYYREILIYAIAAYGNETIVKDTIVPEHDDGEQHDDKVRMDILKYLPIHNENLFIVDFNDDTPKASFILFKYNETMVLSFRGTHTLEDKFIDLRFEYVKLNEGYVHSGFYETFKTFRKEYFEKIFELIKTHKLKKLLVTGHSLGGSLALMTGYFIKTENLLENYEIVTFSTAPCFSKELVHGFDEFKTFVYWNDIVPFCSYGVACDSKFLCCSVGKKADSLGEVKKYVTTVQEYLKKKELYPKLYHLGKVYKFKPFTEKKVTNPDDEISNRILYLVKEFDFTYGTNLAYDLNCVKHHHTYMLKTAFDNSISKEGSI